LHSSPCNRLIEGCTYYLAYVRLPNCFRAEFWDIRVTVSFVVVSGFVAWFIVVCFLHIFVYFSACFYMEAVG